MTDIELIEYYKNLLIIQYISKTKAPAHIEALMAIVIIFELITKVENGYNVNTAIGKQLDIIGKYLGVDRNVPEAPYILTDADYRFYQKLKIIQNNSNHSTKNIIELVYQIFGTDLIFFDRYNMSISYLFPSSIEPLVLLAKTIGLLPKPAAVGVSVSFTINIKKIFGYKKYGMAAPPWAISYKRYGIAAEGGMKKYGTT